MSRRSWDASSAGVFDRGDGERVWHSDQHRPVFSITPRPPMLLQLGDGLVPVLH